MVAQAPLLVANLAPEETATPLMAQYLAIKAQHSDCLVFFRLGDFYELFFEDAVKASKALDIALTRRGQMQGQDIPMCGVPAHSYEGYLAKLIRKGFRVALCEQKESPEEAKKRGAKSIVTRDVVRIITPGTLTEEALLDARSANYLACLTGLDDELALSWLDLASGQPTSQSLTIAELNGAVACINPSEILIPQRLLDRADLVEILSPWHDLLIAQPNSRFDSDNARRRLTTLYGVRELTAFGDFSRMEIAALGALLDYIELTQKSDLKHLLRPQKTGAHRTMSIDAATRRNLELTRTLAGERQGSLLATIDRSITGAGARLLGERVSAPLTEVARIHERLDAVAFMIQHDSFRKLLRSNLQHTPDLERALARLALGRGGPRDLASIRDASYQAMRIGDDLLSLSCDRLPSELAAAKAGLGDHNLLIKNVKTALAEDLPLLARDGNFINKGYRHDLDELFLLRDNGRQLIAMLQQKYSEVSGIAGLKIRHNNVIGYYIEVTPSHADKLVVHKDLFIHRQSLATAARFTTVELSELERKITEAADKALALELQLFNELVQEVLQHLPALYATAEALAILDVTAALAELAVEQNYNRPEVDQSLQFSIDQGRHPVVEQALKQSTEGAHFIANNCDLAPDQRLWLLTGPNMAGKSTFLRQNALIAILAQIGSFVPAAKAHIGVIDRLFSRVGAADDLARGRSTFMVEMVETAAILNQSGERALVILDEIGRGTATYDGLSIAWATIEHLHDINHCRALFATHYHELTSLTSRLAALRCYTMRIKEWKKDIIFLHEVAAGIADRSYGIHVAQMAGLPRAVIDRAEVVLEKLEAKDHQETKNKNLENLPLFSAVREDLPLTPSIPAELDKLLIEIAPDEVSPKQALELLYQLKRLHAGSKNN